MFIIKSRVKKLLPILKLLCFWKQDIVLHVDVLVQILFQDIETFVESRKGRTGISRQGIVVHIDLKLQDIFVTSLVKNKYYQYSFN